MLCCFYRVSLLTGCLQADWFWLCQDLRPEQCVWVTGWNSPVCGEWIYSTRVDIILMWSLNTPYRTLHTACVTKHTCSNCDHSNSIWLSLSLSLSLSLLSPLSYPTRPPPTLHRSPPPSFLQPPLLVSRLLRCFSTPSTTVAWTSGALVLLCLSVSQGNAHFSTVINHPLDGEILDTRYWKHVVSRERNEYGMLSHALIFNRRSVCFW